MTKISAYDIDTPVFGSDKVIGTDHTGGVTKNYTIDGIRDYIIDETTGNIVVNNPDEEDITTVDSLLKFKDRDAVGGQKGYKIIRADFDWLNIPISYANSIWEIRYDFDLNNENVVFPTGVYILFNGGRIGNYQTITAPSGSAFTCIPNGFDGSGTIDPTFVFDVCFTQTDKDKLDGIQAGATISNLGYTPSATDGTVTNSGGIDATIPAFTATNAGLIPPINTLTEKVTPTGSDWLLIEDVANSNSKKKIQIGSLPAGAGSTNLGYTASPTDGIVTSDTGTDATLTLATNTNAGLFSPANKVKLDGIAAGAEVNVQADWDSISGDSYILNKPTYTLYGRRFGPTTWVYNMVKILVNVLNTRVPEFSIVTGICTTNNYGYIVGDKLEFATGAFSFEGPITGSFQFDYTDITAIEMRIANGSMYFIRKDNNQITNINPANWNLYITVWSLDN